MFSPNNTPHIVAMLKWMNISMLYWNLNQIEYKRKNINLLLTKAILRIRLFEILLILNPNKFVNNKTFSFFSEFKKPNHDDQFMGGTGKKILYQSSITGWKFAKFDVTFRIY